MMDKEKDRMTQVSSANRILALFIMVTTAFFGLTAATTDVIDKPPKEGTYVSATGERYLVSTSGLSALSINGPKELCLLFWRAKEPKVINGSEVLKGQKCGDPASKWMLGYSSSKQGSLLLFPPDVFEDSDTRMIVINHRTE